MLKEFKDFIARGNACVINGYALFEVVGELVGYSAALREQAVDLILYIVTLDIYHIYCVFGNFVLLFALANGVLEVLHLALEVPLDDRFPEYLRHAEIA